MNTTKPSVICYECGARHEAEYSHPGRFGEGPIFAVVCTEDNLTSYYTTEVVEGLDLRWGRDDFGTYADSHTEAIRYYVRREGKGRAPWITEAVPTIDVAGVTVVKPGTHPRWVERGNPTRALARAIAEAYETEPERAEGKATNRLTRAVEKAYSA